MKKYFKKYMLFGLTGIILMGILGFLIGPVKSMEKSLNQSVQDDRITSASGVCPPFKLRDEAGNIIDPIKGINDTVPYSPKQTCGVSGCHNYEKITEGFHFTQGKGESVPKTMSERYNWVSSPGNYGGNWCSPAPLYRQLAAKNNTNARTIDMTSFDFVTATCGNCHPGGGPLEYDRDGKRYDTQMNAPESGMVSGGENGLDGDYYKARWSETGVIEADCLLCHMPEYDYAKRNSELANLNFRWAATAGAGLGLLTGKVSNGERPDVIYDKSKFDADGNVVLHMAPEPRNETCLKCHAKPGWKKRGASFSTRTDVHMAAGLRCVDCHTAGRDASDPKIRGKEFHQIGKGDDPSVWARNDLDNTVRSCENCHDKGWGNAPRVKHAWLPDLHFEKISCQACHIPTRSVKSALVQASDVYNPAPRITPPGKHIWTFFDQEMNFWNHYGELDLFTFKDQPTNITRPTLIKYKGKIYPSNRVHSAWVGFEEQGKSGLNQLFMKDFYQIWAQHRADPNNKYPALAKITDDNNDGLIEVNRPEEIDALINETKAYLSATGFPLENRRLVWVSDSKAYYSSKEVRELAHEEFEATAYASVYKFSHDIAPSKAAFGSGGCIDCHSKGASFFKGAVLDAVFTGEDAQPKWIANHEILGISSFEVGLGNFRESILKPTSLWILIVEILLLLLHFVVYGKRIAPPAVEDSEFIIRFKLSERLVHFVLFASFLVLAVSGVLFLQNSRAYNGTLMRNYHMWIGIVFGFAWLIMLLVWFRDMIFTRIDKKWLKALGGYLGYSEEHPAGKFNAGQKLLFWLIVICGFALIISGIAIAFYKGNFSANLALLYTVHDLAGLFILVLVVAHLYMGIIVDPHALHSIFGGKVNMEWMRRHHSEVMKKD
jgi:formate dehydrogenase gamma subunit